MQRWTTGGGAALLLSGALMMVPGCGGGGTEGTGGSTSTGGADGRPGTGGSGNASGGDTGGGSNVDDLLAGVDPNTEYGACVTYLMAQCSRRDECTGNDRPVPCPEVMALCPDFLFSEGSAVTIESALSCAETWRTHSCDALAGYTVPDCSLEPGIRTTGESCAFPSQCDSRSCTGYGECGTCVPVLAVGAACDPSNVGDSCPNGYQCRSGACEAPEPLPEPTLVGEGELCTVQGVACQAGLYCLQTADYPRCSAAQPPGSPCDTWPECSLGQQCTGEPFVCTELAGLGDSCATVSCADYTETFCNELSVCEARKPAGAACTRRSGGCQADLTCECPEGAASCDADSAGACTELRFVGQSCDGAGQRCLGSGVCEAGTCVDPGTLIGTFAECPM